MRRIYFTEGVDVSSQLDSNALQNKLDSLTFQVRCSETEKKKLQEQVNELTAHKIGAKEEMKSLEQKLRNSKDDCASFKNQVKILQSENLKSALPVIMSTTNQQTIQ